MAQTHRPPPNARCCSATLAQRVRIAAAYRDRYPYQVDGRGTLGEPRNEAPRLDAARAALAIRRARPIAVHAAKDARDLTIRPTGRMTLSRSRPVPAGLFTGWTRVSPFRAGVRRRERLLDRRRFQDVRRALEPQRCDPRYLR